MLTYLLFLIGFVLLIQGAHLLVEGSASIAKRFKISALVIGLTIVAFGTSAPEFAVNLFASVSGNTGIAIGNILGSNIANVLLILGIAACITPLTTKKNTVWKEIPFSLLGAVVLAILVNDVRLEGATSSMLSRADGLILLAFFVIFLYYTFGIAKVSSDDEDLAVKEMSLTKSVLFVMLGLAGLVVGGKWIVDGAVHLATSLGLSESLVGLTVVAVGTSLPELATSAIAAYKKQTDIAIGNVVGSNIFNIFWILGMSSVINPLPFSASSDLDIVMTIGVGVILFITMFIGKRHVIERWQGVLMLVAYVAYVIFLILNQ